MPITGKLTALKVAREKRPGLYGDGGGLYLQVTARGSKSWIFRFWIAERDSITGNVLRDPATNKIKGRSREMGLGSATTVSLAEINSRRVRALWHQAYGPLSLVNGGWEMEDNACRRARFLTTLIRSQVDRAQRRKSDLDRQRINFDAAAREK